MRLISFFLIIFVSSQSFGKCAPITRYVSEIEVDSCFKIEGEEHLLIVGRELGYFELLEGDAVRSEIVRIAEQDQRLDKFVWVQSPSSDYVCGSFKKGEHIFAVKSYPCCDVLPYRSFMCKIRAQRLVEFSNE